MEKGKPQMAAQGVLCFQKAINRSVNMSVRQYNGEGKFSGQQQPRRAEQIQKDRNPEAESGLKGAGLPEQVNRQDQNAAPDHR